jgi:hypothetical protein
MSTAEERLVGVLAKIERAKCHVHDLESRIKAFREANPDLFRCDQDPKTGNRILRLQKQFPVEFSLMVGDAVNNMRSALDHLVCRLIEANGSAPTRRTCFPLCDTAAKFKESSPSQIKGVGAQVANLIEAMQPYNAGYDALGVVCKLNNADKHRVLIMIACGIQRSGISNFNRRLFDSFPDDVKATISQFIDRTDRATPMLVAEMFPVLFKDGETLAEISWPGGPPLNVDEKLEAAFEVAISEPEIVQFQPVVPLLTQLTEFVESVISQYRPFL